MSDELHRLHRGTALHIQRQLSARPRAGNFTAHPLDFLHDEPFLPYKRGEIDESLAEAILNRALKASRDELLTFDDEPFAILSESGSGKSILVARMAQRLMKTIQKKPEQGILVLFAQLKHAKGKNLMQEICSSVGLGRFSNIRDLRSSLPEELRSHRFILLIDSLDESKHRRNWHEVDRQLRTPGNGSSLYEFDDVLPVWVSRKHDWSIFSPRRFRQFHGLLADDNLQLDIAADESIGEAIHDIVANRLDSTSKTETTNAAVRIKYLLWALENYQILHIPRTTHAATGKADEFFRRVMNTALDHLEDLIQVQKDVEWDFRAPMVWENDLDIPATARTNLAYALLFGAVEEAVHRVPESHQLQARQAVNTLLSKFSERAQTSLKEDDGELDDALPRELSIQNVHLLSALNGLGIILRSDHDALHYRWAHRDLTAVSILFPALRTGSVEDFESIMSDARKEKWALLLTNAPGHGRKSNKQFHRKSGRSCIPCSQACGFMPAHSG